MIMIDKRLVNLTDEYETQLAKLTAVVMPNVDQIVERVYSAVSYVASMHMLDNHAQQQLIGSYKLLVGMLFQGMSNSIDHEMNGLGQQYARQGIPVEFITSVMALVHQELLDIITQSEVLTPFDKIQSNQAITAVIGYCQMHIQQAYSQASLHNELARFLKVTGISRRLFDNLAVEKLA